MAVYLIRHTKPILTQEYCYGVSDIDLADDFEEELAHIKNLIQGFNPEEIYSSPLRRCAQLAKKLFPNDMIHFDKRLQEMNFGEWEQKKWTEIDKDSLKEWADNFETSIVPKGEGLREFNERVSAFWEEIEKSKDILVVAHAGTIRMILSDVLAIPLNKIFSLQMKYGQVIKLSSWGNGDFSVEFL